MGELIAVLVGKGIEFFKPSRAAIRAFLAGRTPSRRQVARRLQIVLNELNQSGPIGEWNVEKIAATLGHKNPEILEKCFDAEISPDFELLDRLATEFSVNPHWLKFGHGAPFEFNDGTGLFPENHFETIKLSRPKGIHFLRSDSSVGEACIVLELSEWNYRKLDYAWHISSHVGGTGAAQIYSMYHLVEKLRETELISCCSGRQVPKAVFDTVMNGRSHPGFAVLRAGRRSDWWDELDAAVHANWDESLYAQRHGVEFVAAQKIVRDRITENRGIDPR